MLELEAVPVLYDGVWDQEFTEGLAQQMNLSRQEGYVVRIAESFPYSAFRRSVGKFVRAEHVGTAHNWMRQRVRKNGLAPGQPTKFF